MSAIGLKERYDDLVLYYMMSAKTVKHEKDNLEWRSARDILQYWVPGLGS